MCIPVIFLSDTLTMPQSVRMLTSTAEIQEASRFFKHVWGGDEDVVPADIAIASGHAGGYLSGAFTDDGTLVAACYGFLGSSAGMRTLHSHVTASIAPGAGFLLKQHQREWALARDLDAITWTFDPLVRRNSVFNLEKLGAQAVDYLVNFYGKMQDEINFGDESDRVFAMWRLLQVPQTFSQSASIMAAINVDESAQPVIDSSYLNAVENRVAISISLPEDIELMRKTNLDLAKRWRLAVREVLKTCFEAGAVVRSMTDNRASLLVEWPILGVK